MRVKETFFVKVYDDADPQRFGVGECAVFRGLGSDDIPDYEQQLAQFCRYIHAIDIASIPYSSMRFGFESAISQLRGHGAPFPPIRINGLIWMGSAAQMVARVEDKLRQGFKCLKLKIGGIDWNNELAIIDSIRQRFSSEQLELRLDANEAFTPDLAYRRLAQLAPYSIHSIEQPIKRGQWAEMAKLCADSPIPIAFDEELIGITSNDDKLRLLSTTKPQYIIIKPSLCGGFAEAEQWIAHAEKLGIGWWVTSALESDVGLAAIAQWVSRYHIDMPQGLGTGQLYLNNIISPLELVGQYLTYDASKYWDYSDIDFVKP